jgi:hypothetical protein
MKRKSKRMDTTAIGREIARDAMRDTAHDPRHSLVDFDIETFGLDHRVRLLFPLRDRIEARHHLAILARAVASLTARENSWKGSEREFLLLVKAVLKDANASINNNRRVTSRKTRTTSMERE